MKLFKKSLAVILTLVMVFSTMSVAANAINYTGTDLKFQIKFFRQVDGNWVETEKAKPGEAVKARMFIGTDFAAGSSDLMMVFDPDYFEHSFPEAETQTKIHNPDYPPSPTSPYPSNGSMVWMADPLDNRQIKRLSNSSSEELKSALNDLIDEGLDFIVCNFTVSVSNTPDILYENEWMLNFDFTVADNDYVRTPGQKGMARVPDELAANTTNKTDGYINVTRSFGSSVNVKEDMWDYDADITSIPGYISVFSNVILDANGGEFSDSEATKSVPGVIGDDVTGLGAEENIPTQNKKVFKGWADAADGDILTPDELAALKYDYEDYTLYAIWEDAAPEKVNYTVEYYKQETDGTYDIPYAIETPEGAEGVQADVTPSAPEGFHVDEDQSVLSGTPTADALLVLKVVYARNTNDVTYKDENGEPLKTYEDVLYGADIPGYTYNVPGAETEWESDYEGTTMPDAPVVYTAKVTKIPYGFIFNAVEGEFSDGEKSKSYVYFLNEVPEDPQDLIVAPEGYEFDKWDKEIPAKVTGDETISTFRAEYKPIDYSASYSVEGLPEGIAVPAGPDDLHIGDKFTVPQLPDAGDGYEVDGWYVDGEKVEPGTEFEMPADDVEFTAKCEPKSFDINFDSNGGSDVDPIPVKYGEKAPTLPVPEREGYTFDGWFDKDGNKVESIDEMPAEDVELKAEWTPIPPTEYAVTYKYDGTAPEDAPALPSAITAPAGETITVAAAPELDGYKFDGWYVNGEKVTSFTMPEGPVEITGSWEKKGGNVNFYLAEGDEPYDSKWVDEGDTITEPEDPEIPGWTFEGWQTKDGEPLPAVMGDEDIDAYAVLSLNKNDVRYVLPDGTEYKVFEDVPYGSEIPVPAAPEAPEHPDPDMEYVFSGWTPDKPATMPDEELTFTATFAERTIGEEYTATYVVDDEVYHTYILKEGDPMITPPDPEKFAHKFAGWSPDVPDTMPGEDVTYTAQWKIDEEFIAVVIGGTVVTGAVIGTIAAANAALITGAAIVGGIIVLGGVSKLVKDTYTVKYIVDGEVYKTYKVLAGAKVPVPSDPSKDGAEFKGWNPEVPERMPEQDLTFEAQWGSDTDVDNPDTGSVSTGLAAFAVISSAAAAAYVLSRKKKDDEE